MFNDTNNHTTEGYERDQETGALLNTNLNDLARHKYRRNQAKRVSDLESLCANLQEEMTELKKMVECLLSNKA